MPRRPHHALAFLLGLWLALAAVGPLGFAAAGDPDGAPDELAAERAAVAAATDAVRAAVGARPLPRQAGLDATAQAWSRHLAVTGVPRPGGTFDGPAAAVGPTRWNAAALAPDQAVAVAVTRWLGDPASRARLLDGAAPGSGIGIARRADGGRVVVQIYAEPAEPSGR